MMTLGEKLKDILAEQIRAEKEVLRAKEDAAAILRAKHRAERTELVSAISNSIDSSLRAGKIPQYKIFGTEQRAWVCRVHARRTDAIQDQDLWDNLVAWLRNEGLNIKVEHRHDNMGYTDWFEVGVELLHEPEVEAD